MPQPSAEEFIAHAIYDPVARRERYLRDRHLKGRGKGGGNDPSGGPRSGRQGQSNANLHGKADQAASNARQIAAFRAKLTQLRAQLQKLLAEAEKGSSSSSSSSKSGGGGSSKGKPMTAQEKADAKKASQKYRDTHKSELKAKEKADNKDTSKSKPTKEEQIAHLRSLIRDVESKLRAAVERARTQTASNGR